MATDKHIDTKILYKYINKNRRICPQKEYWYKAARILYAGYKNEMELREKEKKTLGKKKFPYLRKPDWIPKGLASDSIKKFVLKKHIAYAAKLGQQSILDAFGWYLINLKEDQWTHTKYKKKK